MIVGMKTYQRREFLSKALKHRRWVHMLEGARSSWNNADPVETDENKDDEPSRPEQRARNKARQHELLI